MPLACFRPCQPPRARDHPWKSAAVPTSPSAALEPKPAPAVPGRRQPITLHTAMVVIHRYVGLTIATFLLVAGITGSVLAFNHELDAVIAPSLHHAQPPTPDAKPLDPFELRERVAAALPGMPVNTVELAPKPGATVELWLDQGEKADNQFFVDPYTGAVVGSRHWGDLGQGMKNLMPFLYRVHYQLALGEVGSLLFGIVALLWTLDCFVGMYLTFPARRAASAAGGGRGWLTRWKPSWLVRGGSLFGAIFTAHRASGLWLWPLLLVFAWSAVAFNLRPVFTPVMNTLFTTNDVWGSLPSLEKPRETPVLGWHDAHAAGKRLMADEAARRGFTIEGEGNLAYEPSQGLYSYAVYSSFDLAERWPGTCLWLDGDSGALVAFSAPTGGATGDTITSWLYALHMGTVGGLAYRILVCITGVVVAGLCITGVIIWWRKRALRRRGRHSTSSIQPQEMSP